MNDSCGHPPGREHGSPGPPTRGLDPAPPSATTGLITPSAHSSAAVRARSRRSDDPTFAPGHRTRRRDDGPSSTWPHPATGRRRSNDPHPRHRPAVPTAEAARETARGGAHRRAAPRPTRRRARRPRVLEGRTVVQRTHPPRRYAAPFPKPWHHGEAGGWSAGAICSRPNCSRPTRPDAAARGPGGRRSRAGNGSGTPQSAQEERPAFAAAELNMAGAHDARSCRPGGCARPAAPLTCPAARPPVLGRGRLPHHRARENLCRPE